MRSLWQLKYCSFDIPPPPSGCRYRDIYGPGKYSRNPWQTLVTGKVDIGIYPASQSYISQLIFFLQPTETIWNKKSCPLFNYCDRLLIAQIPYIYNYVVHVHSVFVLFKKLIKSYVKSHQDSYVPISLPQFYLLHFLNYLVVKIEVDSVGCRGC